MPQGGLCNVFIYNQDMPRMNHLISFALLLYAYMHCSIVVGALVKLLLNILSTSCFRDLFSYFIMCNHSHISKAQHLKGFTLDFCMSCVSNTYSWYQVTDKNLLREVMNGSASNKDGRVKDDGYIYMVLEYGEIDLAHMLSQKWKELDSTNQIIDENWLRFYWQVLDYSLHCVIVANYICSSALHSKGLFGGIFTGLFCKVSVRIQ